MITNYYLDQVISTPNSENKWHLYLDTENLDWSYCYLLSSIVTRDTNVQSLQYRILHRIYPCNYWLSKWNENIQSKCDYCNEIDYLEHYFFSCESLDMFWKSLRRWWLISLQCTFDLTEQNIIFGVLNAYDDDIIHMINYCILYAKFYITRCRRNNQEICLYDFLRYIKNKLEIEILYYETSISKEKDLQKWKTLYNVI